MTAPAGMVFIVDDEASVRKSLVRLFRSAGRVAEAFESAAAYLNRSTHDGPSCLVLDVQMPDLSGLELQRVLGESGRAEQVVFITGNADVPMCARAMKAGAADFLTKPFDDAELLAAVERALARSGEHRRQLAGRSDARAKIATLTPREFQVFQGVITGKMNKEIAADLGTSIKTVKVQRGRVMGKTGTASVAELVGLAQKAGVGEPRGS